MTRVLAVLGLYLFSFCALSSQEVFNYVIEGAARVINNPSSSYTTLRIAQFKMTSMTYLQSKAFETRDQVTEDFLNTQAYYMNEFVTMFVAMLVDETLAKEPDELKRRILLYTDASLSNPLFGDSDKETTLAYVDDSDSITPFSLDTDWEKACAAVKYVLRQ
ncbi:MAG: hypothetical protein J1F06_05935 [Prevotellaceae bacterium]|nr:hypothetical protein [Prevotellaceae bacterium]